MLGVAGASPASTVRQAVAARAGSPDAAATCGQALPRFFRAAASLKRTICARRRLRCSHLRGTFSRGLIEATRPRAMKPCMARVRSAAVLSRPMPCALATLAILLFPSPSGDGAPPVSWADGAARRCSPGPMAGLPVFCDLKCHNPSGVGGLSDNDANRCWLVRHARCTSYRSTALTCGR
jgi:hypothetical protein